MPRQAVRTNSRRSNAPVVVKVAAVVSPLSSNARKSSPTDIDYIVHRYDAGETTEQIGAHHGISKTRVARVLREQGVTIRRQGLAEERLTEAAELYAAGRSLAWLGVRYGVSHTTVAAALRRQGMQLRPRPGWT